MCRTIFWRFGNLALRLERWRLQLHSERRSCTASLIRAAQLTFDVLHLATLGAARTLALDDKIGNLEPGKEADFIVLDSKATSITCRRLSTVDDVAEKLFALILLGDDRCVAATYLMGELAYKTN